MTLLTPAANTPSGRVSRYVHRLRDALRNGGGRAALGQLGASLRWRFDPACRAIRALQAENAAFDRDFGTDTQSEVPLTEMGVTDDEARHGNGIYRGISTSQFDAALGALDVPLEHYTFVDYGSGKGKALLLAVGHPFRRIIGVEYVPALHEIAIENLKRHPIARASADRIEARCGDARDFEPPHEPLVCFFFNPFDASIWRCVLERLSRVHVATRAPIHLIYLNVRDIAELGDLFDEFPEFTTRVKRRTMHILSAAA